MNNLILVLKNQRNSDNGRGTPNVSSSQRQSTGDKLGAIIQIIQQVTELVPIDTAKNILTGITSILLLLQKNVQNKTALTKLAHRCDAICSILGRATKGVSMDDISETLSSALHVLESSIKVLHSEVDQALQRSRIRRLVGATLDETQIKDWSVELDRALTDFTVNVNIVSSICSEQMYRLLKHRELPSLRPEPPPPPPAMFFGREHLLAQVKDALLRNEDVALIGPGGIGKSTIAKALLNDDDIQNCYPRRFFVTYDTMDPATITPDSFINHISSALGLPMLGVESKSRVISNLASSPVLIVLDNAETFEDAANLDVVAQISSVVSDVATTQGVTVLLTSRTRRSARDVCWKEVEVPLLEKVPARRYFRTIYHGDITDNDVDELLAALDYHPLSIRIIAHAAKESRWTGKELLNEWQVQQIKLLQTGYKKENLGFTIQLSLNSPSVLCFGDDALKVLRIITFFPQGINRSHVVHLFPSIPNISSLVDTLCTVSLVHRSGTFLTSLAPIRLFILDTFPATGLNLLGDIRFVYYGSLEAISEEKDSHAKLFISDHLNIEHLIAYDIAHSPDHTQDATLACQRFLDGLSYHKVRPTRLAHIVPSLSEGSNSEKNSKAQCLFDLGSLYFALSNYSAAKEVYSAAIPLFVATGDYSMAALCASNTATSYNNRGLFSSAQRLLQDFIHSPSWEHIDEDDRPGILFALDVSKMHTSPESSDNLFIDSMDHPYRGLDSRVSHWRARMLHCHSTPEEVDRKLELIQTLCMTSSNSWDRWSFLEAKAEAAFLGRRFDAAMELLDKAYDAVGGEFLLTLIVVKNKAAVASVQGDYELSRSLLQYTLDTLNVVATPSSADFLDMRYVHGRNELYAKNHSEARRLLADVVVDCDAQGNILTKMKCTRALGEIEISLGWKADSERYFGQTVELCREAGVRPDLLGVCEPMKNLDDEKFPGWKMFLWERAGQ